jgi:hypothetical protein
MRKSALTVLGFLRAFFVHFLNIAGGKRAKISTNWHNPKQPK